LSGSWETSLFPLSPATSPSDGTSWVPVPTKTKYYSGSGPSAPTAQEAKHQWFEWYIVNLDPLACELVAGSRLVLQNLQLVDIIEQTLCMVILKELSSHYLLIIIFD
jgi:hypothetical protein